MQINRNMIDRASDYLEQLCQCNKYSDADMIALALICLNDTMFDIFEELLAIHRALDNISD